MPRKQWVRKNSYCRGSKLTDPVFEQILWYYLLGAPANETVKRIERSLGKEVVPSEKTVGRHYKRIGEFLIKRMLIGFVDVLYPEWKNLRAENPAQYEARFDSLCSHLHDMSLDPFIEKNPKIGFTRWGVHPLGTDYRLFSTMKNGVRTSSKEHLALAVLRTTFREIMEPKRRVATSMSQRTFGVMYGQVRKWLRQEPC